MHFCEVAAEFLLGHFINTTHDMFVSLSESFSDSLEVPWMSWCTDCEPSLILPLVTLLTCCCTCLCTHLLRHFGSTLRLRGLPHLQPSDQHGLYEGNRCPCGPILSDFTSHAGLSELQEFPIHLHALELLPSCSSLQRPYLGHRSEQLLGLLHLPWSWGLLT